jgi:hypothetical protein
MLLAVIARMKASSLSAALMCSLACEYLPISTDFGEMNALEGLEIEALRGVGGLKR